MPLTAIIVDDEQLARDETRLPAQEPGRRKRSRAGKNGLEAINLIREHNPDLVFLDVQMPGWTGSA